MPWPSGKSGFVIAQKVAVRCELEAGFRHATTGKLNPAINGYLFRIREGEGSYRKGMGSASHQLNLRYNGALTPTVPTAIRLLETVTFLHLQTLVVF